MGNSKDEVDECYGFRCDGFACDNVKEAWETYVQQAKMYFKWIKGYKYWRSAPAMHRHKGFECNKEKFTVKARCFASMAKMPGMEEAKINGPYPSLIYDNEIEVSGFGLTPKQEERDKHGKD